MTIEKYVTCEEFKKIIDEKIISATAARQVLQKRGILPIYTSTADLSKLTYRIFYGSEFITSLNELLNLDQNNLKSTVVMIKPKNSDSTIDYMQEINDEFQAAKRIPNTPYTIKEIIKNNDSNEITLKYSYKKQTKGKISLLSYKDVDLNVSITPIDNKYKVSIVHEGMSESSHFVNFLDKMMNSPQANSSFNLLRIRLDGLTNDNKVDFFDKFSSYKFEDWTLSDITSVSLNRSQNCEDDIDETLADSTELQGITSAILNGAGLRKVDFVQECMNKGFFFQSMRYKLEHKSEPIAIELDISFKQSDLKVIVHKTYELDENSKYQTHMLSHKKQKSYIDFFQNIAYEIYNNLIQTQKKKALS